MKVLITGGSGFIGSYLAKRHVEKGDEVTILVRGKSNLFNLEGCRVHMVKGDICEKRTLYSAVEKMDYIYHTAALKFAYKKEDYYRINHLGTKNLLEVVSEIHPDLKIFVYLSSLAAVGPSINGAPLKETDTPHPLSHYGKSKLLGEKEVLDCKDRIPVIIIRPPAVYGPKDRDVYHYFKWAKRGFSFRLTDASRLSICYIIDLIDGIMQAVERGRRGEIYFIADENNYSWDEIDAAISSILKVSIFKIQIPHNLIPFLGFVFDTFSWIRRDSLIFNSDKLKEISCPFWVCDVSKAKEELGFKVGYSLMDGLKETIAWYKKEHWL